MECVRHTVVSCFSARNKTAMISPFAHRRGTWGTLSVRVIVNSNWPLRKRRRDSDGGEGRVHVEMVRVDFIGATPLSSCRRAATAA